MAELHDGDLFLLAPHPNPIFAEYLNTHGRKGWRLYDKHGVGVLLEVGAMERLSLLVDIALGRKTVNRLATFDSDTETST